MKINELPRPGLIALGLAGFAATALLGFAAGIVVARDPDALRRTARRVAREAARGLERAALVAAQAREHVGDLWAEAREEALAEVDAADFERTAQSASKAPRTTAGMAAGAAATVPEPAPAHEGKPVRKRASSPRKPRATRSQTAQATPEATGKQA